jgi:DNA-binding NarL/FixJ family response regulator
MASEDLLSATILLIDGYEKDRTYYVDRLKASLPTSVILEAKDGQSALALLPSRSVDCIVLELVLPDISAFEVLLRLVPLVKHQTVAVVMLARETIPSIADLARQYGAQSVLIKRLTSGEDLAEAIGKAIAVVAPRRKDEARRKRDQL